MRDWFFSRKENTVVAEDFRPKTENNNLRFLPMFTVFPRPSKRHIDLRGNNRK